MTATEMSPQEATARTRKVALLVATLAERAQQGTPGLVPHRVHSLALAFAHDAGPAGSAVWEAWAEVAGVHPPSQRSVDLVVDTLTRLSAGPDPADDPFAGL